MSIKFKSRGQKLSQLFVPLSLAEKIAFKIFHFQVHFDYSVVVVEKIDGVKLTH